MYGGNGMKNDFGGHDNYHLNNIYAYVGRAVGLYDAPMLNGHEDHFSNNKVIMTGNDVGSIICTGMSCEIFETKFFVVVWTLQVPGRTLTNLIIITFFFIFSNWDCFFFFLFFFTKT